MQPYSLKVHGGVKRKCAHIKFHANTMDKFQEKSKFSYILETR